MAKALEIKTGKFGDYESCERGREREKETNIFRGISMYWPSLAKVIFFFGSYWNCISWMESNDESK